jgi:2-oxoglutarate dehydrogenase E1 component
MTHSGTEGKSYAKSPPRCAAQARRGPDCTDRASRTSVEGPLTCRPLEEANALVSSPAPSSPSPSSPEVPAAQSQALTALGPNEWLVDEIYQQYQRDPESVDRAWWDFFRTTRRPTARRCPPRRHAGNRRERRRRPPAPPSRSRSRRRPPAPAPAAPAPKPQHSTAGDDSPAEQPRPSSPRREPKAETRAGIRAAARKAAAAPPEDTVPLRGPAARVVTTWRPASASPRRPASARSREAAGDNRVVINNHLKRGRGGIGQLSPTSSATPWCERCTRCRR